MRRRTAEGLYTGQGSRSGRNASKSAGNGKETDTEEGDKMIRTLESRIVADGVNYVKLAGLSTDSKPTAGICTGSEFLEADTGSKYTFAEGGSPAWAMSVKGASDKSE